MMKRSFRTTVIVVMSLAWAGCQTKTQSKPLTEMSEVEKRAVYEYGPVKAPEKEHHTWKKALAITGGVIVAIPLILWSGLARSGSQK